MDALTPAAGFDYNPRVRELFADLGHAGALTSMGAVFCTEGGSITRGARINLQIELNDACVNAVRYQAYGCPHFLAACESLARWLEGRPLQEGRTWPRGMLERELAFPVHKRERLLILEDVLGELIAAAGRS